MGFTLAGEAIYVPSIFRQLFAIFVEGFRVFSGVFGGSRGLSGVFGGFRGLPGGPRRSPEAPERLPGVPGRFRSFAVFSQIFRRSSRPHPGLDLNAALLDPLWIELFSSGNRGWSLRTPPPGSI